MLVNSILAVGPNRVALGFFDAENRVLTDLEVTALFYPEGQEASADPADAIRLLPRVLGTEEHHAEEYGGPTITVYGGMADFPREGRWSVTLNARQGDRTYEPLRATFQVFADPPQPIPGEAIPASRQIVLRDVAELSAIDTSLEPDPELHQRTVAEALDANRPLVIAFATPAFCETRFCGPIMEDVIQPLHADYADRVEFIHIEPYDVEKARVGELIAVPAMEEWGLVTEPWVFVVGADGLVEARFEGAVTREEIEPILQRLLGG